MAPGQRDSEKAALTLTGDAGAVAAQLSEALDSATGFDPSHYQNWTKQLTDKVGFVLGSLHKLGLQLACIEVGLLASCKATAI